VNVDYIEEVRSLVLQRYFMLTFTYNIRKFGQGQAMPQRPQDGGENRGNWNRGEGGGRPGGGFGPGGGPGGGGGGNRDF
jgi:hypothetical protein